MLEAFMTCLVVLGAAQAPKTPEYREAYLKGGDEAARELEEGRAVLYDYGLLRESLDRETGLPFEAIAGCDVRDDALGRAAGHNDRIREFIREHGYPGGSYKRWEKELFDLRGALAARASAGRTARLSVEDPPATSPGGRSTLELRRDETIDRRTAAPSTTSEIRATTGGVARTIPLPRPLHEARSLDVAWGEEGSDVAFLRCDPSPGDAAPRRRFAALDVRTGRWLRFEFEAKPKPHAAARTP